jgi:hypothetical protein
MIDPARQAFEELLQRGRIGGIERGAADGADVQRAALAVSSPIPALPPISTTVCPSSCGARVTVEPFIAVLITGWPSGRPSG